MNLNFRVACLLAIALLPACSLVSSLDPMTVVTIEKTSWGEYALQNELAVAEGPEGFHYWHIGMLSSDLDRDDFVGIAQDFGKDPWGYSASGTQRLQLTPRSDEMLHLPLAPPAPSAGGKCVVRELDNGAYAIELADADAAHVPQKDPQTCWAACIATYGKLAFDLDDVDQLEIADRLNLVGDEGNRQGDLFRIILGLQELQGQSSLWSQRFGGSAGATLVLAPNADDLVASLLAGHPAIAGIPGTGGAAGHAVLIIGGEFAQYGTTAENSVWRAHSITILDPIFKEGRTVLTAAEMAAGLDFFVNYELAKTLLEKINAVRLGIEKSLEEEGFTLFDTLKGLTGN